MKVYLDISIEMDFADKTIWMGEENSSGVSQKFDTIEDISKHLVDYIEMYHSKEINRAEELMRLKNDAELIYEVINNIKNKRNIDSNKLNVLQIKKYITNYNELDDLQGKLDKIMEKFWDEFEDVPFYSDENGIEYLDEEFLGFKVNNTSKQEIWLWFNERHSRGIHYLLYEYEKENELDNEM